MNVSLCESAERWDGFVNSLPGSSGYHLWAWRELVEETFGHRGFYLTAGNGAIDGALPLVLIDSLLFGKFIVSVPFASYGGVLAASGEARASLLAAAVELARELGARHVELRQAGTLDGNFIGATPKVTMQVRLPSTVADLWRRFSPRIRNRIRGGRRHGLRARWGGPSSVGDFYRVFAANMRNLGSPVYPCEWFRRISACPSYSTRILILWREDRPVAAAFLIRHGDTMELPWSASIPEARKLFSTLVLYCEVLERALAEGCREVDLGRCTRGSGTYQFKSHWGAQERPLWWYYWLAHGSSLPRLRPDNPRFAWATSLWKLMPLAIANRLGPRIARSIP